MYRISPRSSPEESASTAPARSTKPLATHGRTIQWVIRDRSLRDENRPMSAMPRKRRLAVKASSVAMGQIQTFRPHRASNRLDGSRSESGKPARHMGAIAFILGSVALAERRLLIGNYDNVKKEPDQRAVAEEMPVSE